MNAAPSHHQPLQIEDRKDLLLLILAASGAQQDAEPVVGVTRLQKYLFLLQKKYAWPERFHIDDPYQFEAYDFGPFDSQLYDDLQFLENAGLISREQAGMETAIDDQESRQLANEWATVGPELAPWDDDDVVYRFALTPQGQAFAARYSIDPEDLETIRGLKKQWNAKPLTALLSWLYKEYPDYAKNSRLGWLK